MPVSSAREAARFPCSACGSDTHYDPASAGLKCAHCGGTTPIAAIVADLPVHGAGPHARAEWAQGCPVEHSIADAIDAVARRGWGTERTSLECKSCGAVSDVDPHLEATTCPFCGSPHVLQAPTSEAPIVRPETLIPFHVTREAALERFRAWIKRLWFRPNALKKLWQLGTINGVYLPFWTFDAAGYSVWTAEAGYHYRDRSGRTRTRWESAAGELSHSYDDELVCASTGLHSRLIDGAGAFNTQRSLVPYRPDYLSGFTAERYARGLDDAWSEGQRRILDKARAACARQVPGDTHRNLEVRTRLSNVTFKHVLLPVWLASYLYRGRRFHFVVNGESGRVHGEAPISWAKVVAAVIAAIAAYGIVRWIGILD